ncbi:MAG: ABC transporter ATP-binding protein [Acidimicrobiaceae bacterium]|nr:ABC transporter ATP-binding protein [Acidimicrobiaceae bacterium]
MAGFELASSGPLLSVRDLRVRFVTERGAVNAVNDVSFDLHEGETLAIVGESGSGKSVTAKTLMNLLPRTARVSGEVRFDGQDVRALASCGAKHFFGVQMTMVFQDPMTSLNPVKKVGEQIAEGLRYHLGRSRGEALSEAENLLADVGVPEPGRRVSQYPHELSGGLRQRVVIAMALSCRPRLLIADEPTTAVDVTVQRRLLDLLDGLRRDQGMAMILITHDLGVARGRADEVAVMYAGRIVETADAGTLFGDMRHPYTEALMRSIPRIDDPVHHRLDPIPGRPPELIDPPDACAFAPRCRYDRHDCHDGVPELSGSVGMHRFACLHPTGAERGQAALAANRAAHSSSRDGDGGKDGSGNSSNGNSSNGNSGKPDRGEKPDGGSGKPDDGGSG